MPNRGNLRRLILASASRTRHHMLQSAGLAVLVVPSTVDEAAVRAGLSKDDATIAPEKIALELACAKALQVSRDHPDALVIGSDQVLAFGDETISKPEDIAAARKSLMHLKGHAHQLHSAVALAEKGEVVWSAVDTANLVMRAFSPAFLDDYLTRGGADLCFSAGAYQIEGLGSQLFEKVEGDHFTILGLPLFALLAELRNRKAILA